MELLERHVERVDTDMALQYVPVYVHHGFRPAVPLAREQLRTRPSCELSRAWSRMRPLLARYVNHINSPRESLAA